MMKCAVRMLLLLAEHKLSLRADEFKEGKGVVGLGG